MNFLRYRFAHHPSLLFGILLSAGAGLFTGNLVIPLEQAVAQEIKIPAGSRWLEVKQVRGTVTYRSRTSRPMKVGDRLQGVGEGIATGNRSSAILAVDDGIAIVKVAENTELKILTLNGTQQGGQITRLSVLKGQAALKVRPFTNSTSRLEIKTPSGIAGVRGTEFGVAVSPSNRTAILTTEGAVSADAQGQAVTVNSGYSSLIYPGEAPTPPRLTTENVRLQLNSLQRVDQNTVKVSAQIDPINQVFLNDRPIEIQRDGKFVVTYPRNSSSVARFLVRSPLGNEQAYEFAAP